MEPATYLFHLRDNGVALATAALDCELDAQVPSCPGWTVADLVAHIGQIHRWVSVMLRDDRRGRTSHRAIGVPGVADVLPWYEEGLSAVLADLDAVGPDHVLMTWAGTQPSRFWYRRMAHETAIHKWDVEAVVGSPRPIDTALAVDGIDEFLSVFVPRHLDPVVLAGKGETMHLHCNDQDGEWVVRLDSDTLTVTRGHIEADVVARGSAADILLLLWGRLVPGRVTVLGDSELLDRWQARVRL